MDLLLPAGMPHEGQPVREPVALVAQQVVLLRGAHGGCPGVAPLGLLQQVLDLGGRGAGRVGLGLGRRLMWVVAGVVERVARVRRLLLQSRVGERVVVEEVAAGVVGVRS